MAEFALQIVMRSLPVGRPRVGDEACACRDAKRRDRTLLDLVQGYALADQTRLRCDFRRTSEPARHDRILRIACKPTIYLPAIRRRQKPIATPDRKRKDRRLSQFLVVSAGAIRLLLRRQRAKEWRRRDDPFHACAKRRESQKAKFVGHAVEFL